MTSEDVGLFIFVTSALGGVLGLFLVWVVASEP